MMDPIGGFLAFFAGQSIAGQPRAGIRSTALAIPLFCLLLGASSFGAVQSTASHRSHTKSTKASASSLKHRARYTKWAPTFPGSHEKLVEQNVELDKSQVQRMNSEFDLLQSELSKDLVEVDETEALKISDSLLDTRRYCRPWTRDFLHDLSQAYYATFGTPLQVNSLVRTADQQAWLRRHNRYAAPAWGDTASTHLAGVAVDVSRRGLTKAQYDWIRGYLQPLQEKGLVDPIEERQPVLHIVVFDKYSGNSSLPRGNSEASEATESDLLGSGGSQP